MGIEGAGAHPFDAILTQLDGTTGANQTEMTVGNTHCEIYTAAIDSWTVYIDGYALNVTKLSDGTLVVDNHSDAPPHYKNTARTAVQQFLQAA